MHEAVTNEKIRFNANMRRKAHSRLLKTENRKTRSHSSNAFQTAKKSRLRKQPPKRNEDEAWKNEECLRYPQIPILDRRLSRKTN
jgi:hypothetical protein